ncbi:hypothetical protein [Nocardioides panacisoli]|uniref:DUF5666 domain-containing protein n=1 Tax=Nocardioides panacisoli TaxID=627624 RepID=A0ABP7IXS9_9ACTN
MTTRAPLDGFENALLTELRQHVATRAPAAARPRLRRRLTAAGAALGAAVAVTAGGLALRPDAAFAVDPQANGDIVVTISSLKDADGLESALRAQGVDAEVDYSADLPPAPEPGDNGGTVTHSEQPGSGDTGGTLERHDAPKGTPAPAGPCGDAPPTAAERDQSTVSVERSGDGVTFTLSKSFVDSDTQVHITTSGEDDGAAGIMVQVEKHC